MLTRRMRLKYNIGDKLCHLRMARGLSQKDLAFNLKISRDLVFRLENNETTPTKKEMLDICNFFGVELAYFGFSEIEYLPRNKKKETAVKSTTKPEEVKKVVASEDEETDEETEEEQDDYNPKFPPLAEKIPVKSMRALIASTLNHAILDATDLKQYRSARAFVLRAWCEDLCVGIDVDYKRYRNHVLRLCGKTGVLSKAIDNAKDFKQYRNARAFVLSTWCENLCIDIDLDYKNYRNRVLRLCGKTGVLSKAIDNAKDLERYNEAKAFILSTWCEKLCKAISINYKGYVRSVMELYNKTEVLHKVIEDSKDLKQFKGAKAFVSSDKCKELCTDIDIDYKSYRKEVLRLCKATKEKAEII